MKQPPLSKNATLLSAFRFLGAGLFSLALALALALAPAPTARAQTISTSPWYIGGALAVNGTTALPVGAGNGTAVDPIDPGVVIIVGCNITQGGPQNSGGPAQNNPLLNFTVAPQFSIISDSPDHWFTITNTKATVGNTRVITMPAGGTLVFGNIEFTDNHTAGTANLGSVFNITTGINDPNATTTISGTMAFTKNGFIGSTNTNGGAISNGIGNLLVSGSIYYAYNFANRGGVYNDQGNMLSLSGDQFFFSNTAAANGGAIAVASGGFSVAGISRFVSNITAAQGGAMNLAGGAGYDYNITGAASFNGNMAATMGGAIYIGSGQDVLIGGSVAFVNNQSGGAGGAIYYAANNTTLTLDASSGGNILFQGNRQNLGATDYANPAAAGSDFNAITFTTGNTSGGIAVTFDTGDSSAPGSIRFFDPITISNTSDFGATQSSVNVDITGAGAVLFDASLHANSSIVNGKTVVHSGNFALANGAAYIATTAAGSFATQAGATLSAAGAGNLLSASTITLDANSAITLDLLGATPGAAPILTIDSTLLDAGGWAQNLTLLNIPGTASVADGDIFNLITLTGAGAGADPFTNSVLANLNATTTALFGNYTLIASPDELSLWLLYGTYVAPANHVLNWTGANNSNWNGANWQAAGSSASFLSGDIINLANTAIAGGASTGSTGAIEIDIDVPGGATIAGMYVSGSNNFTLTGNALAANATAGGWAGELAASGQLVLGAIAGDDATTIDTTTAAAAYTGTLTLANESNDFQNGIHIRTGALAGDAASLTPADPATNPGITIDAAGTLIFDQSPDAGDATYAGAITGAGQLIKTNAATLTLAANSAAFTGTTNVTTGALLLDASAAVGASLATPAALGGDIHVAANATFGGSGTAGAVTLAPDATLQVGLGTQDSGLGTPTLTLTSNLSLGAGSILNYTNITNTLQIGGAITQTGSITLALDTLLTGSHAIIDATTAGALSALHTDQFNVVYGNKVFNSTFTLDSNDTLWLTISNIQLGQNNVITWTNKTADTLWFTSTNWQIYGIDRAFTQGDIVNLADAATAPAPTSTLNLNTTATVAAMYVSGTASYNITGAGSITADPAAGTLAGSDAANGKLVLGKLATDETVPATEATFTGTLNLAGQTGANNFLGGVEINTGALRIANTAQLGTTLGNLQFTGADAGGGALILAANITIDDAYSPDAPNRLAIGDGATPVTASIIAEPGVTLTMQRSYSGTQLSGTDASSGGAIYVAPLATLILTGAANGAGGAGGAGGATGAFLFDSNTSASAAGAIYISPTAAAIIDHATFTNNHGANGGNNGGAIALDASSTLVIRDSEFTGNLAGVTNNSGANGGAIAGRNGSTIDIASTLFTTNTANGMGGAVFNNQPGQSTTIASSTFLGNLATSNGGALAINTGDQRLLVRDTLFDNNTSNVSGGAIYTNGSITGTIANTLIQNNTALTNGGGLFFGGGTGALTIADTSFLNNTAYNNGGAIQVTGAQNALTYKVTAGNTSLIAGNTALKGAGIYINNGNNISLTIDTAPGATLDQLDALYVNVTNNGIETVNKTGAGAWNLADTATVAPNNAAPAGAVVNFTIAQGALHLYRAGETSYNGVPVAAGSIINTETNANYAATPRGVLNFTLADAATLSAGGGNTIAATTITLGAASTLQLDATGAPATATDPAYSILTLATTGTYAIAANGWTQNLDLLNLYNLPAADGSIFNLITLTGTATGAGSTFTNPATFNLLDDLPAGFLLQLSADSRTLQLYYSSALITNNVLTWTGAAPDALGLWRGANWTGTAAGPDTTYNQGDIINLANTATPAASNTIVVNTGIPATVTGLYLSGTENYTITGAQSITGDATVGKLATTPAATGKLILGARATDDAATLDTTAAAAYTGTLTLANLSNNFQGGIEIRTGALVGNAATLGSGTKGITLAAATTLTLDQPTDATYAAPITGAPGSTLVKTNTAALTLAADATAGNIHVDGGALLLAENTTLATPGGTTSVSSGATLGGLGTLTGPVTLDTGATLQIGLRTPDSGLSSGTLTLTSNLNLSAGSTLNYTDITNTLLLANPANLTAPGATDILIDTFQSGTHNLGNIGSLMATPANLTVTIASSDGGMAVGNGPESLNPNSSERIQAYVYQSDADLLLVGLGESRILQWTDATGSGTWSTAATTWTNDDTATPVNRFLNGDQVLFGDIAGAPSQHTIYNSGTGIIVSDMTVSATSNYTFTGAGITADPASVVNGDILTTPDAQGKLTKAGSGTLAFQNAANNFTGGIDLAAGALTYTDAAQLGGGLTDTGAPAAADITYTGAALLANASGSNQTLANTITVASGVTGTIDTAANTLTLTNALGVGEDTTTSSSTAAAAPASASAPANAAAAPAAAGTLNSVYDSGNGSTPGTLNPSAAPTYSPATLAKTGVGTLILAASSTGAPAANLTLAIQEGSLSMANNTTFDGAITLAANTSLAANAATYNLATVRAEAGSAITLSNGATLNATNLRFANTSTLAITGLTPSAINGLTRLTGTVAASIADGSLLLITGTLNGSGGYLKTGGGELQFAGADALRNTGVSQLDAGLVHFTGSFGAGPGVPIATPDGAFDIADALANGDPFFMPSSTYTIYGVDYIIPEAQIDLSGYADGINTVTIPGATFLVNGQPVVVPDATGTIMGDTLVVPSVTATAPGISLASTVTQTILLNGGTLAFNVLTTGTNNTSVPSEATADDWKGLTIDQGPNAASSVITGTNTLIHVGAGDQQYAIRYGVIVAIDAGEGGVTTLSNTSNNFLGMVRVDSGTLLVTSTASLGNPSAGGNNAVRLALAGGDVSFATSYATNHPIEMRADATIDVAADQTVQFSVINKPAAYTTATLTKTGSGAFINNGALQATALTIAEGRYIANATGGTPNNAGAVDIRANATFQLTDTSAANTQYAGYYGGGQGDTGQIFTVVGNANNPGNSNSNRANAFIGDGTLEITAGHHNLTSALNTIANTIISGANTVVLINNNLDTTRYGTPDGHVTVDGATLVLGSRNTTLGNVTLANGGTLGFLVTGYSVVATTYAIDTYVPAHYENTTLVPTTLVPAGTTIPAYFTTKASAFRTATLASLATTAAAPEEIPTLHFNSNIALGMADHLTILAPVTGTYNIAIQNYGLYLPEQYQSAMRLIDAPAGSDADFLVSTPVIESGLYKYTVSATTTPTGVNVNIAGAGAMANSVALINSLAASMPLAYFSELDTVAQRLGELHDENRDQKRGPSAWMRGNAERLNFNNNLTGATFDEDHYGAEAGVDYKGNDAACNLYMGAFAGYGQVRRKLTDAGDATSDSVHAGVYLTIAGKTGWYADAIIKYNNFKTTLNPISPTGERTTATYNNNALGGSLEIGKRHDIAGGLFIEPQIQGAVTRMESINYATDSGMTVDQLNATVMRARAGFRFGYDMETTRGMFTMYFRLHYGNQWVYDGQRNITAPSGQSARFSTQITGETYEGGLGLSWLFTRATQLYFDYSTTQTHYYIKPYALNLGIRHLW